MPTGNLPESATKIWETVYNKSLSGSCNGDKACAAKVAWAAVHAQGWNKDNEGNWNKKSLVLPEFSMYIDKASFDKSTQEMRWRSVNSDTSPDAYQEKMSLELFKDFTRRIENDEKIPAPFYDAVAEENWDGGMPYLSISHYKSAGGKNVPGIIQAVYVDGEKLKSHGILKDNEIGHAVFKSLCNDLYGKSDYENKIRISIGFLDLQHSHGDFIFTRSNLDDHCPLCAEGVGNKTYLKGQLVHLALTRVPVNPRTDMEVEKMAGQIVTKKQDAESILGEATKLIEEKSDVKEELVIKSEETPTEDPKPSEVPTPETVPSADAVVKSEVVEETVLEKTLKSLLTKAKTLKDTGVVGAEALKSLQDDFDKVGDVLKSEFSDEPKANTVSNTEDMREMFKSIVAEAVAPLAAELAVLKAQGQSVENKPKIEKKSNIPAQRSIKLVKRSLTEAPAGTYTEQVATPQKSGARKISDLARETTVGTLAQ